MLRLCAISTASKLPLPFGRHKVSFCKSVAGAVRCQSKAPRAALSTQSPPAVELDGTQLPQSTLESLAQLQQQIGQLSQERTVPPSPPLVFVISGPSGVGKDAVIKELQLARPKLHFVVNATSRPMRPKEVDGVDYIFVSKEQFEKWIEQDELLEHAVVYGEYKGILRSQIAHALADKQDVVLRLDVQGAATMRRLMPDAVSIFLVATSQHELVHRLLDRKTEPLDKLVLRVQTANEEVAHLKDFDYVVTNGQGQLSICVSQINAIMEAEKCKRQRLVC